MAEPVHTRERRKLRRVMKRIPAWFTSPTARGSADVKNLSKEGLFLRCSDLPQAGEEVQILIQTRGQEKIELVGSVRWTTAQFDEQDPKQAGFGVHIPDPGDEYRAFFTDLLLR